MWGLFSFFLRKMGSSAESENSLRRRRRPLYTCGISLLEIGHIAYAKAQDYEGPLSSVITLLIILVRLVTPIIYIMRYQWLTGLSFADGNILAIENIIEKLFPPSGYVFDRIDELVQFVETLPPKFDDAIKDFPENIHMGSFLDWTVVYTISWLNSLVNTLSNWGTQDTGEKEITVDDNSNLYRSKQPLTTTEAQCTPESLSASKSHPSEIPRSPRSPTYKEALTNGTRKTEMEKKLEEDKEVPKGDATPTYFEALKRVGEGEVDKEQDEKKMVLKEYAADNNQEGKVNKSKKNKSAEITPAGDPILDLFESGWLRGPGRKGN